MHSEKNHSLGAFRSSWSKLDTIKEAVVESRASASVPVLLTPSEAPLYVSTRKKEQQRLERKLIKSEGVTATWEIFLVLREFPNLVEVNTGNCPGTGPD